MVLFGKEREIHVTTLTNPFVNNMAVKTVRAGKGSKRLHDFGQVA